MGNAASDEQEAVLDDWGEDAGPPGQGAPPGAWDEGGVPPDGQGAPSSTRGEDTTGGAPPDEQRAAFGSQDGKTVGGHREADLMASLGLADYFARLKKCVGETRPGDIESITAVLDMLLEEDGKLFMGAFPAFRETAVTRVYEFYTQLSRGPEDENYVGEAGEARETLRLRATQILVWYAPDLLA